jgi:hypothetical protein
LLIDGVIDRPPHVISKSSALELLACNAAYTFREEPEEPEGRHEDERKKHKKNDGADHRT